MPVYLSIRPLTTDEAEAVEWLARPRTVSARAIAHAQIIWLTHQGARVAAIAQRLDVGTATVRLWLLRFNAEGLAGLQDRRQGGRPATYTPEQVGAAIATSLTDPQELSFPFAN